MEPNVVVVLLGTALLALLALGRRPAPERQPVPVRADDDDATQKNFYKLP
jgi:hypothetical protein